MGYKRCVAPNEFEDLSFKKAKRFECNSELPSFADVGLNCAFVKPVISGEDEDGFYNIQWYDAPETDAATEIPHAGDMNTDASGHVSSSFSKDDTGSGATPLSSVSSDCLEFGIPQKAFVPLDDTYLTTLACSPRRQVPVGPNHQATIPVWKGRVNKILEFKGTNNYGSPSPGLVSVYTADEDEERLMGTSVVSMADSSLLFYKDKNSGGGMTECNCLDQGSIRCVRQHIREAREIMRMTLGDENFANLGFCDMGEEVALQWSEEEEEVFHEVVYANPASSGRDFWKHLSATLPSRTKKEIVSYYFNVFMVRRRAAQNRSRFLDIDSDDDECHTSNAGFYGFEVSEEGDPAIESPDNQDDQDNDSDEDDVDDDNFENGTDSNDLGSAGYDLGNTTEEEGRIEQRLLKCKLNSQIDSWSEPFQLFDRTPEIPKEDFAGQDDSCLSFECQTNMDWPSGIRKEDFGVHDYSCMAFDSQTNVDVSYHSCGLVDASPTLQARGFNCDENPRMPSKLDLSSNMMEHVHLLEPFDTKGWYPGYSTGPAIDIDFLPTSNLIQEFFGHGPPNKKDQK